MFHEEVPKLFQRKYPTMHVIMQAQPEWLQKFLNRKAKDPRSVYLHSGLTTDPCAQPISTKGKSPQSKQDREALARQLTLEAHSKSVIRRISNYTQHSVRLRICAISKDVHDTKMHIMLVGQDDIAQFCRDFVLARPKQSQFHMSLLDKRSIHLDTGKAMLAPMREYWWSIAEFQNIEIWRQPRIAIALHPERDEREAIGSMEDNHSLVGASRPWNSAYFWVEKLSGDTGPMTLAQDMSKKGDLDSAARLGLEAYDLAGK
jgi:hypothetical protein